MGEASILQQLEAGVVDFTTAFLSISKAHSEKILPTPSRKSKSQVGVVRSLDGKVLLAPTGEVLSYSESQLEFSQLTLLPKNSICLEDGMNAREEMGMEGGADAEHLLSESKHKSIEYVPKADAVKLTFPSEAIALISLNDQENRNMFSPALIKGVQDAFAKISDEPATKVVVVTGYGNWFCSGGTPETLEAIRSGAMSFLDDRFFKLCMDCPIPTIAAMQGHALGGGFTFGLYADLVVMAEHAYYAANFMEHGFTPGVGATFLFPYRFGPVLGNEMMLTARRYQGRELKSRGASMEIVSKDKVLPKALEMAQLLANKPLLQLKRLKAHLVGPIQSQLISIFEKEEVMHDIVFAKHRESPNEEER